MNYKKLACGFGAVFVTFFVMEWLIHGVWLNSTYEATASLWRPKEEMGNYMAYMIGGKILVALFFAWIFLHGYTGKGMFRAKRARRHRRDLCGG